LHHIIRVKLITHCSSRFLVHIATILPGCHIAHHQDSLVGIQDHITCRWFLHHMQVVFTSHATTKIDTQPDQGHSNPVTVSNGLQQGSSKYSN
jgi:hypothetical protein